MNDDRKQDELDPRIRRMIELAKGYDAERALVPAGEPEAEPEGSSAQAPAEDGDTALRTALDEALRRAILHARRSGGLSQSDIAARLEVSASMVSNWVRGHRPIPDQYLPKLARLLDVDLRRTMLDCLLALGSSPSEQDLLLARLIAGLNDEAKEPLARLLQRLQG